MLLAPNNVICGSYHVFCRPRKLDKTLWIYRGWDHFLGSMSIIRLYQHSCSGVKYMTHIQSHGDVKIVILIWGKNCDIFLLEPRPPSRARTSLLVLPFCAQKYMVVWCRVIRCKKNGGCWKLRRWNVHIADCLTFLLVERSSTSREWYRYGKSLYHKGLQVDRWPPP